MRGMEKVELTALEHSVERMWVAQPAQGRQPVIRLGRLVDGRWWASRDGFTGTGAWAFTDELQAETAAHRWSERSGLRWRSAALDDVSR